MIGAACFAVMMCEMSDCLKIGVGVREVRLPEGTPLRHHRIFAGDAVDEDVEPALLLLDAGKERFDLGFDGVIDANRNRRAADGLDHLRGFVDGLGPPVG